MEFDKKHKNFWEKKSYRLVYLKKVPNFAAQIRDVCRDDNENNNIKR